MRIQLPNSCLYGEGVGKSAQLGKCALLAFEVWKKPESLPGGEGEAHL